ncbi:MAG: hypothetical protein DRM99_05115 [Thermoplasmata archaeon]|nr:MAG: hypothetical protein DRM99_05115 [Thermoplasmata archaeon]
MKLKRNKKVVDDLDDDLDKNNDNVYFYHDRTNGDYKEKFVISVDTMLLIGVYSSLLVSVISLFVAISTKKSCSK